MHAFGTAERNVAGPGITVRGRPLTLSTGLDLPSLVFGIPQMQPCRENVSFTTSGVSPDEATIFCSLFRRDRSSQTALPPFSSTESALRSSCSEILLFKPSVNFCLAPFQPLFFGEQILHRAIDTYASRLRKIEFCNRNISLFCTAFDQKIPLAVSSNPG